MRYTGDSSEKGKQIYQVSPTSNILSFINNYIRFQLEAIWYVGIIHVDDPTCYLNVWMGFPDGSCGSRWMGFPINVTIVRKFQYDKKHYITTKKHYRTHYTIEHKSGSSSTTKNTIVRQKNTIEHIIL